MAALWAKLLANDYSPGQWYGLHAKKITTTTKNNKYFSCFDDAGGKDDFPDKHHPPR
ncbi:MAG TPA: hypothetical protein PKA00_19930 [Saprospiraceae bacterium]|nr:hypothetical protein [Saprospiraceae bacterium]